MSTRRKNLLKEGNFLRGLKNLLAWLTDAVFRPGPIREFAFTAMVLALIASTTAIIIRRGGRKQPATVIQSSPANGSLVHISASERDQFQQFVVVFKAEVDSRHLDLSNSFLLFNFWLFNGSLFSIYIKDVRGPVRFTDQEVAGNAELMSDPANIPRGNRYKFVIRQWMNKDAVGRMREMTNAGSRSEFSFDSVYVTLASREVNLEERRLDLPLLSSFQKQWEIRWPI